jgi:hypothetical protein
VKMRWASDRKICAVQNCQNGGGLQSPVAILETGTILDMLRNTFQYRNKALVSGFVLSLSVRAIRMSSCRSVQS